MECERTFKRIEIDKVTREEYLSRPLINGIVYDISPDRIKVYNEHTLFFDVKSCGEFISKEDFAKLLKEVRAKVKGSKVKVRGLNKVTSKVNELYDDYKQNHGELESLFNELTKGVKTLQKVGIHLGCSDDTFLSSLTKIKWEIEKYYYSNTVFSEYTNLYRKLKNIIIEVDNAENDEALLEKKIIVL